MRIARMTNVILAACVLHNFCLDEGDILEDGDPSIGIMESDETLEIDGVASRESTNKRLNFAIDLFRNK